MYASDHLLAFGSLVSELALVQIFADLNAALDMRAGARVSETERKRMRASHSISSSVFFTASGRSLNFVDFVNGGGP